MTGVYILFQKSYPGPGPLHKSLIPFFLGWGGQGEIMIYQFIILKCTYTPFSLGLYRTSGLFYIRPDIQFHLPDIRLTEYLDKLLNK